MMNKTFSVVVKRPDLDPYSKRQYNADVFCGCCGRGIPNRNTAHIVVTAPGEWINVGVFDDGDERPVSFLHVSEWEDEFGPFLGRDPVEFEGTFIGSHCAKQLPKGYKMTCKKMLKAWDLAGNP